MTHEEAVKRANEVREGVEKDVDDLAAHFEGGIYSAKSDMARSID